jgi:cytochrome c
MLTRKASILLEVLVCLSSAMMVGCHNSSPLQQEPEPFSDNSDWQRGQTVIEHRGCAACHTIPGIQGANALVGPPLDHMARRVYVAGVLINNRANLVRWIRNPPDVDPLTAMPNLHISTPDAQAIASYLYTLR